MQAQQLDLIKCLLETTSSAQYIQEHTKRSLQKEPSSKTQRDPRKELRKTEIQALVRVLKDAGEVEYAYCSRRKLGSSYSARIINVNHS